MFPRSGMQGSPAGPPMGGPGQGPWPGRSGIPTPNMPVRPPSLPGASMSEASKHGSDAKSSSRSSKSSSRKKKVKDKVITQQVIELVPESQAYIDLLAFENKLDTTIMRKRLDIQEALKRPIKQKRKLRIYVSTNFYAPKPEEDESVAVPQWEIRVEGKLIDDPIITKDPNPKGKRKFSSFFKNLIIELDRDVYGPDNHLVEWHRTPSTQETDGFQVKRPLVGDKEVSCSIFLMLDYQPPQFKLNPKLGRVLGIHTQTRPVIVNALWQYIKNNNLQDHSEREYINNDKYLEQPDRTVLSYHPSVKSCSSGSIEVWMSNDIFECPRMKFCEIPQRLKSHLMPPDPIIIRYGVNPNNPESKKATCYDIDVEVDDSLREMMQSFLLSTASQQEISTLDSKIHETVEGINQLKIQRDFFLSFSQDPQSKYGPGSFAMQINRMHFKIVTPRKTFINDWLVSQSKDLKTMTDVAGNPEEERRSEFFNQSWTQEAVHRYFYRQVQQKRAELEQALGIRSST